MVYVVYLAPSSTVQRLFQTSCLNRKLSCAEGAESQGVATEGGQLLFCSLFIPNKGFTRSIQAAYGFQRLATHTPEVSIKDCSALNCIGLLTMIYDIFLN